MNGGFGSSGFGGLCAALAVFATVSCGTEKADESAAKTGGAKATPAAPVAKAGAPAAASPVAAGGLRIDGKATLVEESKPSAESPLRLEIGEGGRLGGSLPVGGSECAVSGVVDDAMVRGWLTCPAAAEGVTPRRGTLVGEKAGASWSGTFAISDDGAATVLGGTWKAGP
jgi:hypothetical protein